MTRSQVSTPLTKDQAYALVDAVMARDDVAVTAASMVVGYSWSGATNARLAPVPAVSSCAWQPVVQCRRSTFHS